MKSPRLPLLALGLALVAAAAQAQSKPAAAAEAAPKAAAAPAGPISNPEMEKAGRIAAQAWLLLLDRRDWGTAWDAGSTMFRQAVPLAAWMEGIPKVREPFGAFVEREPVEVAYKKTLPGRPDGDYVTVLFTSRFAKKADVQELVTTVREPDGRWRITGYTAR